MNANRRSVAPVRKLVAAILGTVAVFVMLFGLGMTSWPVVALGAAMLALAIGLTLVNVVRRGARTWVAGTAHVTSASEPPASSAYGRCELQIVVAAPGLPTSAVKVRDPRVPMDRWPVVGDTLPVMVDVDDMRRVRIQWDQMPTHTEAVMNPAATYPDPLDDLSIEDDLLGEPEAPPWVTRDRQWGRGADETDTADLSGQLDDLHPGDLRERPVVVRDAPGGGPIVLEGTLVESDARAAPLPRRPRPSPSPRPRPRPSATDATTGAAPGAATGGPPGAEPDLDATARSDEASAADAYIGTISGTDDPIATPDPGTPDPGTPDPGTPDPGASHPATPEPATPDSPAPDRVQAATAADPPGDGTAAPVDGSPGPVDGGRGPGPVDGVGEDRRDTPVDLPLDEQPPATQTAPRPVAMPMGAAPADSAGAPVRADAPSAGSTPDPEIDLPLDEPGAPSSDPPDPDPVDKLAVLAPDGHPSDHPPGAAADAEPEAGPARSEPAAAAAPADGSGQGLRTSAAAAGAAAMAAPLPRPNPEGHHAGHPEQGAAGAQQQATPPRQRGDRDHDSRIDRLMTAYPSARPGPAGAIHGVGITVLVTDLDRSVRFYRDMLGFFEIDSGHGSAVLASGDTRLVLRTVHDLSPMTGRLIYLNLEVGDVDAVYEELGAKGVKFVHGPRAVNRGERLELWAASFQDPDGHNIAVTQWRAIG